MVGPWKLNGLSEGAAGTTGVGALTLTATSTIDFAVGVTTSVIQFAGVGTHTASTILQIINWDGSLGGGGSEELLFAGTTTDFTSKFTQTEVSFNNVLGYDAIQFSGFYEITPVPEPSTWVGAALAMSAVLVSQLRKRSPATAGRLSRRRRFSRLLKHA